MSDHIPSRPAGSNAKPLPWAQEERTAPNLRPWLFLIGAGAAWGGALLCFLLAILVKEPELALFALLLFVVGIGCGVLWGFEHWGLMLHGRWVPADGSPGWVEFLSGGVFKREDGLVGTYIRLPNQKFIDIRSSGRRIDSWKVLVFSWGTGVLEIQDSSGRVRTFKKGKTLAEKQASFFYTDRSTFLHGVWQPLTGTDEWVQFTDDGAVVFSNGSAGRYSMTGEEPNEVIEIEMVGGSQRQFKIVSLTSAQLVIAEGTDTTTFRRPVQAASRTGTADTGTTRPSGGAAKGVFGSLWAFLTRSKCPKCGQRAADQTKAEQISEVTQRVESEWVGGQLRQMVMNVWVERRTFCCEQCKHKWQEDHQCRRIA